MSPVTHFLLSLSCNPQLNQSIPTVRQGLKQACQSVRTDSVSFKIEREQRLIFFKCKNEGRDCKIIDLEKIWIHNLDFFCPQTKNPRGGLHQQGRDEDRVSLCSFAKVPNNWVFISVYITTVFIVCTYVTVDHR